MKLFWLTARISLLFALLMAFLLALALHLFGRVVGADVIKEVGALHTREWVLIAERLEDLRLQGPFDGPACRQFLTSAAEERGITIAVVDTAGRLVSGVGRYPPRRAYRNWHTIEINGRVCETAGPPGLQARIPLFENGRRTATLVLSGGYHTRESHAAFLHGLLLIGFAGLVGIAFLSLYLTVPLRRMSRSMDRIASGDLEHRVGAKGRDEVAAMGQSFNAMADRVQAMVRGQKELLAGASHELRSPLARLKMSLELLRESGAPPRRLADIEADVDALGALVEELLVASRLDFGEAAIAPELISLEELARQAWARAAPEAEAAGMTLRLDFAADARSLRIDPALGGRILGNLFENAVRYAGKGSVLLASRRVEGDVEVSVSDEGPGVDQALLSRLFDPFFRADPSRSRKTGAMGLGLMIVQRAVQAHGGRVSAGRSAEGGLRVAFRIPGGGDQA